jgi:hypothetical protein
LDNQLKEVVVVVETSFVSAREGHVWQCVGPPLPPKWQARSVIRSLLDHQACKLVYVNMDTRTAIFKVNKKLWDCFVVDFYLYGVETGSGTGEFITIADGRLHVLGQEPRSLDIERAYLITLQK